MATITKRAGTAVTPNETDWAGRVLIDAAVAGTGPDSQGRVALATASSSNPIGICVGVDAAAGGAVTVALDGERTIAKAGATITMVTHTFLMVEATGGTAATTGRLIPATDGNYHVARFIGQQTAAADDLIEVVVDCGYLETT